LFSGLNWINWFYHPIFKFLGVKLLGWVRLKNLMDCEFESLTQVYNVCIILIFFFSNEKYDRPYFGFLLNLLIASLTFNLRQYLKEFCFLKLVFFFYLLLLFFYLVIWYHVSSHGFKRFTRFGSIIFLLLFNIFGSRVNDHNLGFCFFYKKYASSWYLFYDKENNKSAALREPTIK
jgi:hypothetical protein